MTRDSAAWRVPTPAALEATASGCPARSPARPSAAASRASTAPLRARDVHHPSPTNEQARQAEHLHPHGRRHRGRSADGAHTVHPRVAASFKCRARLGHPGRMTCTATTTRLTPHAERAMSDALRSALRGEIIDRDHAAYDEAAGLERADRPPPRRHRSLRRRGRRRRGHARVARHHRPVTSIRGGGHQLCAGSAICDDGLVIDLSAMRAVHVNATARTARVQPAPPGARSTGPPRSTGWPPRRRRCRSPAWPASPSAADSA